MQSVGLGKLVGKWKKVKVETVRYLMALNSEALRNKYYQKLERYTKWDNINVSHGNIEKKGRNEYSASSTPLKKQVLSDVGVSEQMNRVK